MANNYVKNNKNVFFGIMRQIDETASEAIIARREAAERIKKDLANFTPVETGALESSQIITEEQTRTANGHFGPGLTTVYLDPTATRTGKDGVKKPVLMYMRLVNEQMDYYDLNGGFHKGTINRGELTIEKGNQSGGHFIEKATVSNRNYYLDCVEHIVATYVSEYNSKSVRRAWVKRATEANKKAAEVRARRQKKKRR